MLIFDYWCRVWNGNPAGPATPASHDQYAIFMSSSAHEGGTPRVLASERNTRHPTYLRANGHLQIGSCSNQSAHQCFSFHTHHLGVKPWEIYSGCFWILKETGWVTFGRKGEGSSPIGVVTAQPRGRPMADWQSHDEKDKVVVSCCAKKMEVGSSLLHAQAKGFVYSPWLAYRQVWHSTFGQLSARKEISCLIRQHTITSQCWPINS